MAVARKGSAADASDISPNPVVWWIVLAAFVIAAGYGVGILFLGTTAPTGKTDLLVVSSSLSSLGALFALALAVERLIEPFSEWLGPSTTDKAKERDEAVAAVEKMASNGTLKTAAESQDKLTRTRRETAIVTWAVATTLAYIVCGGLKVLLLSAIVDIKTGAVPSRALDLFVTRLVVGAGTKPLHDLVSNLQKSSSDKTDTPAKVSEP